MLGQQALLPSEPSLQPLESSNISEAAGDYCKSHFLQERHCLQGRTRKIFSVLTDLLMYMQKLFHGNPQRIEMCTFPLALGNEIKISVCCLFSNQARIWHFQLRPLGRFLSVLCSGALHTLFRPLVKANRKFILLSGEKDGPFCLLFFFYIG